MNISRNIPHIKKNIWREYMNDKYMGKKEEITKLNYEFRQDGIYDKKTSKS